MPVPSTEKPKLIPVKVPWYVSPSTPFLRLTVGEDPGDCPTEVDFLAFCPLEKPSASLGVDAKITAAGDQFQLLDGKDPHDRIVRVTFDLSGCARMYPSHSNVEIIEAASYDWSELKYDYQYSPEHDNWGEEEWDEYNRPEEEEWQQTGICPNPRMYEVENSSWLKELQALGYYKRPEVQHYIILGHSAYIEVIASGWHWKYTS